MQPGAAPSLVVSGTQCTSLRCIHTVQRQTPIQIPIGSVPFIAVPLHCRILIQIPIGSVPFIGVPLHCRILEIKHALWSSVFLATPIYLFYFLQDRIRCHNFWVPESIFYRHYLQMLVHNCYWLPNTAEHTYFYSLTSHCTLRYVCIGSGRDYVVSRLMRARMYLFWHG